MCRESMMPYWDGYPFHGTTQGNRIRLKKALEEGKISKIRYDNYVNIYTELKEKRKW